MEKKKEKKPLVKINVKMVTNGYVLDVADMSYMYYNAEELVEGMLIHVGLERQKEATQQERQALLEAIQDGSAVVKLQGEVNNLQAKVRELKNQLRELRRLKMKDER